MLPGPNGKATLVLIALDNAAAVADELGHASRDLLLQEFHNRITGFARASDKTLMIDPTKACVLLRGVTEEQQIELAVAKLERVFEGPVTVVDHDVRLEVRGALVPPDAGFSDMDGWLRIAESGVRECRRNNGGFVIRRELTTEFEQETLQRTREVERGIARGEFHLFYQPKVRASFGNVVGAEALMRWMHGKHGLLGPDQFLPFCDDPRLKRALCWFSVKSAIASCSRWPAPLGVAVNVPPQLVGDPALLTVATDALGIFGLAPSRLTVEMTEEAFLDDPDLAMNAISTLRGLGVRVSLDDFGTGYSSLAYLRALELDELKIDRVFVTNLVRDGRDRDIVKAIIGLAHTFSMRVVAEGIEDAETADVLKSLGCDLLQGYYFGRPVPEAEFLASL